MEAARNDKGRIRVPEKQFTARDVDRLKTQLEWGQLDFWKRELLTTLRSFSPVARALASLSVAEHEELRRRGVEAEVWEVDAWAAKQTISTFDVDNPRVKWVLRYLSMEEEGVRDSVVRTLEAVRVAIRRNPAARRKAKSEFDEKKYFRAGDREEVSMEAAYLLRADFEALPEEYRTLEHGLFRELFEHAPSQISRLVEDWRDKLHECEERGVELPWTYEQMARLFSQKLAAQGGALVMAGELARGGPPRSGGGDRICDNCGKEGHIARRCQAKCSACGEKSCPGTRGLKCIAHSMRPITTVQGATGRAVPSFCLQRLKDAQEKWKRGQRSANAAEAGRLGEEDDYENQWGDEEESIKEVGVADHQLSGTSVCAAQAGEQQRELLDQLLSGLAGGGKQAAAATSDSE